MKAKTIQAFAGDSILLQVAVYDDRSQAFDLDANKIQTARFEVPALSIAVDGEMKGNLASFRVESDRTTAGSYPYHVLLIGDQLKFTVAFGLLQVMSLAE